RIVAESFLAGGPAREGRIVNSLALRDLDKSTTAFSKGGEAIARYSFSRVDESPTPWEEGSPVSSTSQLHGDRVVAGNSFTHVAERSEAGEMLSFASDPRSTIAWSGPASRSGEKQGLESVGENSS